MIRANELSRSGLSVLKGYFAHFGISRADSGQILWGGSAGVCLGDLLCVLSAFCLGGKFFSFQAIETAFSPRVMYPLNSLAEVRLQEGEPLENALRRFKRKVQTEDIIKEVKRHSYYLKPGEKKRVKQALARKRAKKKIRKDRDSRPDRD
jgi:small subunit ribosomal protein S21